MENSLITSINDTTNLGIPRHSQILSEYQTLHKENLSSNAVYIGAGENLNTDFKAIENPGIWSFEGVGIAHILLSGTLFLAAIWHWVFWDLDLFVDSRTVDFVLDLP